MEKDITDLFDRNNTLDLQSKDKLGQYNKLITYPDAKKALGEYVINLIAESRDIFTYDDKDDDEKILQLHEYFATITKQFKL